MENISHNISVIQNIVLKKAIAHELVADLEKVTKFVTLAAAAVLSNITPYLAGETKISERECKLIEDEFEKIRERLNKKAYEQEEKLKSKIALMGDMLDKLRNREVNFEDPVAVANMREDFYQVVGCVAAYRKWKVGDQIKGPRPNLPDFKVDRVIKNKKGLQIVVLVPDPSPSDKSIPPILCCRGTRIPPNPHNLVDDMNDHIGQYSLEESKDEIGQKLAEVAEKYGPAVISGHSLGGAIAQNITTEFCDRQTPTGSTLIGATYHFNSPGVGEEVATLYEQKIEKMAAEIQPKVYAYHHAGDVVSLAGGPHIKATVTKEVGEFYSFADFFSPIINLKVAHCWTKLVSEFKTQIVLPTRLRKVTQFVSERIRMLVSAIFKQFLLYRISQERLQKDTAKKITEALRAHTILPAPALPAAA